MHTQISQLPRRRRIVDAMTRRIVGLGGAAAIAAIALIFFYLVWVAAPLLGSASIDRLSSIRLPSPTVLALGVDDGLESLYSIDAEGSIHFVVPETGEHLRSERLGSGPLRTVRLVHPTRDTYALVSHDSHVRFVRTRSRVRFSDRERHLEHVVEPLFEGRSLTLPGTTVFDAHLGHGGLRLAALDADGGIEVSFFDAPDEGRALAGPRQGRIDPPHAVARVDFGPRGAVLHATGRDGAVTSWDVVDPRAPQRIASTSLVPPGAAVTSVTPLLGRLSLMVADDRGSLLQWFLARSGERMQWVHARTFAFDAPLTLVAAEPRRKGILALDAAGSLHLVHTTSERHLATHAGAMPVAGPPVRLGTFSPRSDRIYLVSADGVLHRFAVTNPHPEVSWSALWQRVRYEGYEDAVYSWQSSSAATDFEPKFSLSPLLFGTFKAAFYAMLFALPIAVMSALYTACFMSPSMRRWVKPGIEIMAALPTVILGFLAGLWLAPIVEAHLAATLTSFVALPAGLLIFAWIWHVLPTRLTRPLDGWAAAVSVPVLALLMWAVAAGDAELEQLFFGGDAQHWFRSVAGLEYDQRNALVIGIAMGLAVIPTIFAISEDAIHGVPRHLATGSLALGATPWQTVTRVVVPTASPGIFSASMIGFGRAIGETMIVLMATGNTALTTINPFEGMRTLAANIATELPESGLDGTHYRILFLSALVLFVITFAFNTVAEVVRQRLRARYANL